MMSGPRCERYDIGMKKVSSVTVDLIGGLGNQLFQVAYGSYLEQEYGKKVSFSNSLLGLGTGARDLSIMKFTLNGKPIAETIQKRIIVDSFRRTLHRVANKNQIFSAFEKKIYSIKNIDDENNSVYHARRFIGYGQDVKYLFDKNGHPLCDLQISDEFCTNQELLEEAQLHAPISVHIRGGDYLNLQSSFGLLSEEYFDIAITHAKRKFGLNNPVWIFTDDEDYVSGMVSKFSYPVRILSSRMTGNSLSTFILMKNCSIHVIANSTYSWWAAYLSKSSKAVYYPKPWFREMKSPKIELSDWTPLESIWKKA